MAAGNASMEGKGFKGGANEGRKREKGLTPRLALKLYKLKFNCLQAAYNVQPQLLFTAK